MRTANLKRRHGIMAAVLGAALLMGGGTYALWTASADLAGGKITAGDLQIEAKDVKVYDISADKGGKDAEPVTVNGVELATVKGSLIDEPSDWLIVPGDRLALVFPYDITLKGDNLVANLTMDVAKVTSSFSSNLTVTCGLYGKNDAVLAAEGPLPADSTTPVATLKPADAGPVAFVIYVDFDQATDGREDVTEVLDLSDAVSLTLTQVR